MTQLQKGSPYFFVKLKDEILHSATLHSKNDKLIKRHSDLSACPARGQERSEESPNYLFAIELLVILLSYS